MGLIQGGFDIALTRLGDVIPGLQLRMSAGLTETAARPGSARLAMTTPELNKIDNINDCFAGIVRMDHSPDLNWFTTEIEGCSIQSDCQKNCL
jgi:hypothetical protein